MTRSVMKSKKLKKHMKAVKFVLLKRFGESEILSTFVETTTEFNLHTKSVTTKNGKVFHLFLRFCTVDVTNHCALHITTQRYILNQEGVSLFDKCHHQKYIIIAFQSYQSHCAIIEKAKMAYEDITSKYDKHYPNFDVRVKLLGPDKV